MDFKALKTFKTNFFNITNNFLSPRKELIRSDDYYKTKTFLAFTFISVLIVIFNAIFRLYQLLENKDATSGSVFFNSIVLLVLVSGFFILGKSKYYSFAFYIFPLVPLVFIWAFYFQYKTDPSIELLIINPTLILILGLILGGLLLSMKELLLFFLLTLNDLLLFYILTVGFVLNWIIPRVFSILLVGGFMVLFTYFRMISFQYLNEANNNLSKEIAIKHFDLIEERKILYSLATNLNQGILIIDQNSNVLLVNKIFSNFLIDIIGQKVDLKLNFNSLEQMDNFFSNFLKRAKNSSLNSEIVQKDEKYYQIVSHQIHRTDLNRMGLMIEIHDITELKKVDILEKKFIQLIMHELRTPVTSLQLSISNLLKYWDKLSDDDRTRLLKSLENQSDRFTEIIKRVSILSDLELHQGFIFIDIEFQLFFDDFESRISIMLNPRKITLKNLIKTNPIIYIDKNKIFDALDNILDNSLKFSDKDSEIVIQFFQENDQNVIVEISDSGIAISQDDLNYVFNRFYKGKNAENISGEGIGLSIAKEILNIHGGDIEIKSILNSGTTVKCYIPVKRIE